MKGAYKIEISHKKLKYELTIKRNITLLRGDTATGKTTIVRFLEAYSVSPKDSGVKVKCEKSIMTLDAKKWETMLADTYDSIVFLDEGDKFIQSKAFADAIANTDNYYVLITREEIPTLPYSIHEIYELKSLISTREGGNGIKTITSAHKLYNAPTTPTAGLVTNKHTKQQIEPKKQIKPKLVVVEYSNAGYDFFKQVCNKKGIECLSAGDRRNIVEYIGNNKTDTVLIIANGSTFGSEMNKAMKAIEYNPNYFLYLPESFEWMLLKSGILKYGGLDEILQRPENYIDSTKHPSWDTYFTELLENITEQTEGINKYNKDEALDKYFTTPECIEKILGIMGGILG